jgi:DNA-directed RNA polymerase subunit RPC12/RpoP
MLNYGMAYIECIICERAVAREDTYWLDLNLPNKEFIVICIPCAKKLKNELNALYGEISADEPLICPHCSKYVW